MNQIANNVVQAMTKGQASRKPYLGYWINVSMRDDDDDLITVECRVEVDECRDSCGTGDSPTTYEVCIHEAVYNGNDYDLTDEQELIVEEKAIKELA